MVSNSITSEYGRLSREKPSSQLQKALQHQRKSTIFSREY